MGGWPFLSHCAGESHGRVLGSFGAGPASGTQDVSVSEWKRMEANVKGKCTSKSADIAYLRLVNEYYSRDTSVPTLE